MLRPCSLPGLSRLNVLQQGASLLPPRCCQRATVQRRNIPTLAVAASASPGSNADGSTNSASSATQPPPATEPAPSPAAATGSNSSSNNSNAHAEPHPITSSGLAFQLRGVHMTVFGLVFLGSAVFAAVMLQYTADMEFLPAATMVLHRIAKSVAFRQLVVIACTILLLRFGMNNVLAALAQFSSSPVPWDKTRLYYVLREVYQPLEVLLMVAALCTISESFVPSLISVPKATVSHVVKSILSFSFIAGFSSVVMNLKSRFCKENAWQAEMKGDVTTQRRWEAYDKLGTFLIYTIGAVLGIQAIGLEVTSVLAIGGVGGLAIGLAGREICENLLNGFLIMSTNPFEVGDEVSFYQNSKLVDGFIIDIGWYRTLVRSYEREVFVIPNAVFSRNIVLNITRKNREFRFFDNLRLRVQDVHKANAIVQDIRKIVRNDLRVITKLHRRIFLNTVTLNEANIYLSFYLEAANRDAFMAIKQELLLAFIECVERHGAKLAQPLRIVSTDPERTDAFSTLGPLARGAVAAYAAASQVQTSPAALPKPRIITAEVTPIPPTPGPAGGSTPGSPSSSSKAHGFDGSSSGANGGLKNGGSTGASSALSAPASTPQATSIPIGQCLSSGAASVSGQHVTASSGSSQASSSGGSSSYRPAALQSFDWEVPPQGNGITSSSAPGEGSHVSFAGGYGGVSGGHMFSPSTQSPSGSSGRTSPGSESESSA